MWDFGRDFGQAMAFPRGDEAGYYQINAGEAMFSGITWYGENFDSTIHIDHRGGRVTAIGQQKRNNEGHPGRPRYRSEFDTNEGPDSFACPDGSMTRV